MRFTAYPQPHFILYQKAMTIRFKEVLLTNQNGYDFRNFKTQYLKYEKFTFEEKITSSTNHYLNTGIKI